jgi:uncharacterized protein
LRCRCRRIRGAYAEHDALPLHRARRGELLQIAHASDRRRIRAEQRGCIEQKRILCAVVLGVFQQLNAAEFVTAVFDRGMHALGYVGAWDTIDWLVRNIPQSNGRVGIIGVSYDGFLTLMALIHPHPALKAAVPVNPMVDGWIGDDWFHNGAFRQIYVDYLYRQLSSRDSSLKFPYDSYDLYDFFLNAGSLESLGQRYGLDQLPFWQRLLNNPSYTPYWRLQAVDAALGSQTNSVHTMVVHGLFDQEDSYGGLAAYAALRAHDPRGTMNTLVLGPWFHAQTHYPLPKFGAAVGKIHWNSDTVFYFREQVLAPFLAKYLDDGTSPARNAPVLAFETGSNEWRAYQNWPPQLARTTKKLYLRAGGALSFEPPTDRDAAEDEYLSDPAKPVPFKVPPIRPADGPGWDTWLTDDQRPFATRTDVLTFVTAPLSSWITISGAVAAHLQASTSGTDVDWVVKLIDVYPAEVPSQPELGGYQLMISGDIMRGRYRQSLEKPTAVAANIVESYRVRMPDANHAFLPGHRIMVQIQSSWFPLYDRNPQSFVPNIFAAALPAYHKAVQKIYHSPRSASYVEISTESAR